MRYEEYTPDAICRAMGLPAFADDPALSEGDEALRLLITPAFTPEICITIAFTGDQGGADVRVFSKMFWHMPTAADRPEVSVETVPISRAPFVNSAAKIRQAIREVQKRREQKIGVLDGIGADLILRSPGERLELKANVFDSDELCRIVADVFRPLLATLPEGPCRDELVSYKEFVQEWSSAR